MYNSMIHVIQAIHVADILASSLDVIIAQEFDRLTAKDKIPAFDGDKTEPRPLMWGNSKLTLLPIHHPQQRLRLMERDHVRGRGRPRSYTQGHRSQGDAPSRQANFAAPHPHKWNDGLAANPLGTIDRNTLRFIGAEQEIGQEPIQLPVDTVQVTNVRALGSYNWSGQSAPLILIPGTRTAYPFHLAIHWRCLQALRGYGGTVPCHFLDPSHLMQMYMVHVYLTIKEAGLPKIFQCSPCSAPSESAQRHMIGSTLIL